MQCSFSVWSVLGCGNCAGTVMFQLRRVQCSFSVWSILGCGNCTGTVMFQLRRRAERPNSLLRKSGSVDDLKVPRMLPAVASSPGIKPPPLYLAVIKYLVC